MQLRLDAADRLGGLVEEPRGPGDAEETPPRLFAPPHAPARLAPRPLADPVAADARPAWCGRALPPAPPPRPPPPGDPGRWRGARRAGRAAPPAPPARRVPGARAPRPSLPSLAPFFGRSVRPSHRALPDATATAEILLALIGLAQERGATSVADLCELASTRTRRVYLKRSLAFGAPTTPGVYLFRDRHDQVLYVGRARDLRARLRSYFRTDRQRPAVEGALGALERIEWRGGGRPPPGAAPRARRP